MIEPCTRLRLARGIDKTETDASTLVFETMKQHRGHPGAPPPTVSDGWGGIREAMVEVYGKVPEYKGIGRPPEKKRPQPGWKYLQVVKERTPTGQVTGTRSEVVYGNEAEVLDLLGEQTAYVERTHLTMRHMNGRLTRKGLGFSKALGMHRAAAAWEDAVYNLTRSLKSLRVDQTGPPPEDYDGPSRKRWKRRTPAMAAGLTSRVWNVKELLRTVVTPARNNT
jgi:hypothetical protein